MPGKKEPPPWKTLIYEFSQETTMHGIRYIVAKYTLRRVVWAMICLTAMSVFTYLIYSKVVHLLSHPKNVNVEVTYTDQLDFPAVTVCNENTFRLTAMQMNGLYDLLVNRLSAENNVISKEDSCQEEYFFYDKICELPARFSFNNNNPLTYKLVETTRQVCKSVCSSVYSEVCSSILYNRSERSCILSAYTADSLVFTNDITCTNTEMEFYRRKRCLASSQVRCDFEKPCNELKDVIDETFSDDWKRVKADKNIVGKDNTLDSLEGHYLYFMQTDRLPGNRARVITDYMNTTGLCLTFVYRFIGYATGKSSTLTISTYTEDQENDYFITRSLNTDNGDEQFVDDWLPLFIELPAGIHQVALDAERSLFTSTGLAVDDFTIQSCEQLEYDCMKTKSGKDYVGKMAYDAEGRDCVSWSLDTKIERFIKETNFDLEESGNYCRNIPGRQWNKPYCLVQTKDKSLFYSECNIPYCECLKDHFKCGNGMCIPSKLTCDGQAHCDDRSDEEIPCGEYISVSCAFNYNYICGYKRPMETYFQWSRIKGQGPNSGSPQADREESTLGYYLLVDSSIPPTYKQTMIMTPIHKFTEPVSLQFYFYMHAHDVSDILQIVLSTSVGLPMVKIKTIHENTLSKWKRMEDICLPTGSYAIGFLARTGTQGQSDIGLDDISLVENKNCADKSHNTAETTLSCTDWTDMCGYYQESTSSIFEWRQMIKSTVMLKLNNSAIISSDCSHMYIDLSHKITSPYYPERYHNNMNCRYTIRAVPGSQINITFIYLDIEAHPTCTYDSLKIIDRDNTSFTLTPICGIGLPDPIVLSSSYVDIIFKSDFTVTGGGFVLQYEIQVADGAKIDYIAAAVNVEPNMHDADRMSFFTKDIIMENQFCLSFDVMIISTLRISLQYIEDGSKIRRRIIFEEAPNPNGEPSSFTSVQFDVKPPTSGLFNIIFETEARSSTQYLILLDNLNIHEGSCLVNVDTPRKTLTSCQISANAEVWNDNQCYTLTCFENNEPCGFVDKSPGPYRWIPVNNQYHLKFGSTIYTEQFSSNAYYTNLQKVAYLVSPLIQVQASQYCLDISYYHSDSMDLYVMLLNKSYITNTDSALADDIIELSLDDRIDLPEGKYHIVFVAKIREIGGDNEAILERLAIHKESCKVIDNREEKLECNFSSFDRCGYKSLEQNGLSWKIRNGYESLAIKDQADDRKGSFLLLDGVHAAAGDRSILISPVTRLDKTQLIEFYVFFHYDNNALPYASRDSLTNLQLARFENGHVLELFEMFKASNLKQNSWVNVTACLPSGTYKVAFIGTLGMAPANSLAIDSIHLLNSTCQLIEVESAEEHFNEIDCDFKNDSKCGFKTYSSSAFLEWTNKNSSLEIVFNPKGQQLSYISYTKIRNQYAEILSPEVNFTNAKCLTMVFTCSSALILTATTNSFLQQILYEGLETGNSWTTVHFQLGGIPSGPVGYLALQFKPNQDSKVFPGGLDRFTLVNDPCRIAEFGSQTVTCDFETDCGYVDESPKENRWIPYTSSHSNNNTYMKAVLLSPGGGMSTVARLVSPPFQLSKQICLTFSYRINAFDVGLNVNLEHMESRMAKPDKVSELKLEVKYYRWENVSLDIGGVGWQRLVFDATFKGEGSSTARQIGLDDVRLNEGICPKTVTQPEDQPAQNTGLLHSIGDSEARLLNEVGSTDMRTLYAKLGHQKEQMLITCSWKGIRCENSKIIQSFTDKGYCFTFNFNKSDVMKTTETGANYGAQMMLNIEQYEYIKEYSSDAGVKVHLHSQSDIARMNDLAFAVEPGSHSMASMKYQYSVSLASPWGNCTKESISYFEDERYTQAKCKLVQETKELVEICGCKNIEMPGSHELCNISKYITCVAEVKKSTTRRRSNTSCPDACVVKTHTVELSSSLISGLSAERLLSVNRQDIESRYFDATEYRLRVTATKLVEILNILEETWLEADRYEAYLKSNILASHKSVVTLIQDGILQIEKLVRNNIFNKFFQELDLYRNKYVKYMEPLVRTIKLAFGELTAAVTMFADVFITYNYQLRCYGTSEDQYRKLVQMEKNLNEMFEKWQDIFDIYISRKSIRENYLPDFLSRNATLRRQCEVSKKFSISDLQRYVLAVADDARQAYNGTQSFGFEVTFPDGCYKDLDVLDAERRFINPNCSTTQMPHNAIGGRTQCISNWAEHNKVVHMYNKVRDLQKARRTLDACYSEYGEFIQKLTDWLEGNGMDEMIRLRQHYNTVDMLQKIKEARNWLQNLLTEFRLNRMTLAEIAEEIIKKGRNAFLLKIEIIYTNVLEPVISEIIKLLDARESSVHKFSLTALGYHEEFSNYFSDPSKFVEAARSFDIWRKPLPNLHSPKIISYSLNSSETWKVWPRSKNYKTFLDEAAVRTLEDIFGAYYNGLRSEINDFKSQLNYKTASLEESFYRLEQEMNRYNNELILDDKFVMKNLLRLDIFFGELKYEKVEQQEGYDIAELFSDIGGYMGLLIGGSAITVCELLDLVIMNSILKYFWHRKSTSQISNAREVGNNEDDRQQEVNKTQVFSKYEFTSHA